MKLGLICPLNLLEYEDSFKVHYFLPYLALKYSIYKHKLLQWKARGDILIMDGSRSSGVPEDLEVLLEGIEKVKPTHVILPSIKFQFKHTVEILPKYDIIMNIGIDSIMPLEGVELVDLLNCMSQTKEYKIHSIRSYLYPIIKNEFSNQEILYIETRNTLRELEDRKGMLVSSMPIRLSIEGLPLSSNKTNPKQINLIEEENKYPDLLEKNIRDYKLMYEE